MRIRDSMSRELTEYLRGLEILPFLLCNYESMNGFIQRLPMQSLCVENLLLHRFSSLNPNFVILNDEEELKSWTNYSSHKYCHNMRSSVIVVF